MADDKSKNLGGRPPKYKAQMAKDLPDMFKEGQAVEEVCAELGITRKTFYEWVKKHPAFKKGYEQGRINANAWWMKLGRLGAVGKNANFNFWQWNVNRRTEQEDREQAKQEALEALVEGASARIDNDMTDKDADDLYQEFMKNI